MRLQSPLHRWEVIAGFVAAANAVTCVEVGCKEGKVTRYLLEQFPELRMVAIDPWEHAPANPGESYDDWDWPAIKAEFWASVEPFRTNPARLTFKQMTSLEAMNDFRDNSIDVVFIDAAHDYQSVHMDITAWWPKVKDSGYLLGHDYQHKFPGVHRAVAEHFNLLRVAIMADSVWAVPKTGGIKL